MEEIKTIVEVKKGGYRPNAGRPPGRKNLNTLPKKAIMEYTSEVELRFMVERAKRACKKNDKMLQWYLEMCFGKPKVVEKEGGAKTVNNIAYFLDSLEAKKLNPFVGDDYGPQIIEQGMADEQPLYDTEQTSTEDSI